MTIQDMLADNKTKSSHEMAIKNEDKKIVRKAIGALGEEYKLVIVQLFFGNKTLRQVGKKLNISAEAVRLKKEIALKHLRSYLHHKAKFEH